MTPEVKQLIERLSELHVELAPVASQQTVAGWLEDNGFRVRWKSQLPTAGMVAAVALTWSVIGTT